jgi:hypothetical protein
LGPNLPGDPQTLAGIYGRLEQLSGQVVERHPNAALRLGNLSLDSIPRLIHWAVHALASAEGNLSDEAPSPDNDLWFRPTPDAIDAHLARELLLSDAAILPAYLTLESHPLSAAADGREPDVHYLDRLQSIASLDAMLKERQAQGAMDLELRRLGDDLGSAHAELIDAAWIRQQLMERIQRMQDAMQDAMQRMQELEEERNALRMEMKCQQSRYEGLQANQQQIQNSLEEAAHIARSQDRMYKALLSILRKLQIRMALACAD